jgi:immunity protein 57 of polymorphic toxin system
MEHRGVSQKLLAAVVVVCLSVLHGTRAETRASQTEHEDIVQAEKAVLASLAIAISPRGASLCVQTPVACVGPDRLELAMSLLAARNTPESLRALAGLVRYRLDGAYAENYDDLLLAKGKTIQPYLVALSPQALHEQCKKEFAELLRASGSTLGDVHEEYACRSEGAIKADVSSTLDAIQHHRQPEP